jgi:hypothetical protein
MENDFFGLLRGETPVLFSSHSSTYPDEKAFATGLACSIHYQDSTIPLLSAFLFDQIWSATSIKSTPLGCAVTWQEKEALYFQEQPFLKRRNWIV